jgi:hypothetical protein
MEFSYNINSDCIFLPCIPIKKAGHTDCYTFGSSAILLFKTRHFPSPSHGGFGFVGYKILYMFFIAFAALLVNLKYLSFVSDKLMAHDCVKI